MRRFIPYLLRRLGSTVVVMLLVTLIAFVLLRLAPGNPARFVLGPLASPQAVARLKAQMGLDQSVYVQYIKYLQSLLSGNLGTAWHVNESVTTVFAQRLPASIELALLAGILAAVIALPFGAIAARRPDGLIDRCSRLFGVLGLGTPVFWLGLLLILMFYVNLHVAPAPLGQLSENTVPPQQITGFVPIDALLAGEYATFRDAIAHLVLPVVTLAIPTAAYLTQIVRQTVGDVYQENFIELARAKGTPERTILVRHALPNALLPILTLIALSLGDLLGGALLVETIFSWPGIGGFVAESIGAQDYAPVEAFIVLGAFVYCLLNLGTDLLYAVIDPRVRLARESS
jgi:peptide/nickel transport system permease protein